MKYLLLLTFSILLISSISAETTFSDNPNTFNLDSYQPPTGNTGLGGGSTVSVPDLLKNGTLDFQNATTNVQNQTKPTVIEKYIGSNMSSLIIVFIIVLLVWLLFGSKKKKEEVSYT